eukprot:1428401-Amphidinium_carterae.1
MGSSRLAYRRPVTASRTTRSKTHKPRIGTKNCATAPQRTEMRQKRSVESRCGFMGTIAGT